MGQATSWVNPVPPRFISIFSGELRQVYREPLEISERAVSQRTLMCRVQDYAWHLVGFECFLPTRGAQAPTITRFEPREAELWHGSRKIIAARFRKREKLRCHYSADSVAPYVLTPRIAATIAIEPCHGFERTHFKRLAEYVAGWNRSSAPVATFISKHALSPQFFRSK